MLTAISNNTWGNNSVILNRPIVASELRAYYLLSFIFVVLIFSIGIFGRKLIITDDMQLYLRFKYYRKKSSHQERVIYNIETI